MTESGRNRRFLVLICEQKIRRIFTLQARRENGSGIVILNRRFDGRVLVVNATDRGVGFPGRIVIQRRFGLVKVFVRRDGVVLLCVGGEVDGVRSGDLYSRKWTVVDWGVGGEEEGVVRRGVVVKVVVEFGGGEDGEDDEIEEDVEVGRSEAGEEEGPHVWGFSKEEMREERECEFQTHCH